MQKIKEIKTKIGFIGSIRENILADLDFAVKNKFDYYEVGSISKDYHLKPEVIKQIKKIVKENNISLILHIPFFLPIASLIPGISAASIKFVKKEIILANRIGAKKITIHSGREEGFSKKIISEQFRILIKNLKVITRFGKKYGIKVGLENAGICENVNDLLNVVNSVKGLGVVFDSGHANLSNLEPVKYFKKVKQYVINIHIHDNDGKSDQHALIGKGNIDFKGLLRECKNSGYYGPFILEVFPYKNILKCREKFLELANQI